MPTKKRSIRKTRNTRQKELIARELKRITTFFSADDLHAQARKDDKDIGIATVYRFLNAEEAAQRLYSYTCNRRKVYSKAKKSHSHFICERTGKVIHFDIDSLDFLKNKIPGSITSFQLEVRGICGKCGDDE